MKVLQAFIVAITLVAGAAPVQPGAYTGPGFDACAAPPATVMNAWKAASPYRSIGIYIGGVHRTCAQPYLTAAWVRAQQRNGWHLVPLYVGLQAPCDTTATPARMSTAQAPAQGRNAATDAVARAAALGLSRDSPLYYDMEAYAAGDAGCRAAVLAFMRAWTIRVHESGHPSGFYSSLGSGVLHQVTGYDTFGYPHPDYLEFARWDDVSTTANPGIPAGYWAGGRRIKQFSGGHDETWGGFTLHIDTTDVDVRPLAPAGLADFTGNGFADVLARDPRTGRLDLYPGHASALEPGRPIGTGWNGMNAIVRIGDLDRDGHEDVVARQASTGLLWLYRGTGGGLARPRRIGTGWNGMRELTGVGDLTGDGVPDLLAIQSSTAGLYVYPGRPTGGLGTRIPVGTRWSGMSELAGVGDFDRDGRPDFVGTVTGTGTLRLYHVGPAGLSGRTLGTGWGGQRDLLGVGDFDRDGYPDLAAIGKTDGVLRVYRGNGTGFQGNITIGAGFGTRTPLV